MSSLPAEVDFTANPAATSARMDQAMAFLVAWLRRVESVQPEFLAVTEQLKAVGLSRLDAVLSPIFLDAQGISAQLAAIRTAWLTGQPLTQLLNDLSAQVTGRLASVDGKLGDVDALLAANFASVTTQLGNNSATVTAQLAANSTSVSNQLAAQNTSVDAKFAALSPTAKWAEASTAEGRAATASRLISAAVLWAMESYVPLGDAASVAPDLNTGSNFTWTIGGNRVLANPVNAKSGQQWTVLVTQGGAGAFVMSFGSAYVPDDLATFPVLNGTAGSVTELRMRCANDGKVRVSGGKPVAGFPSPQYISQRWYGTPWTGNATSDQNMYDSTIYMPIEIKTPVTIDALVCYASATNGYARMALYTMVGGKPGLMLRQTGQVSTGNYTTVIPLTSNITLAPGLYMIALASGGCNFTNIDPRYCPHGTAIGGGQTEFYGYNTGTCWQTSSGIRNQYGAGFIDNPGISTYPFWPGCYFRVA